jgi:CHAD domain-containing protein
MSGHDPFMNVADFLKNTLHQRERSLLRFASDAAIEENLSAQHRLRIAIKHFRYRLELASFFTPEQINEAISTAKRYQELLGTMHDLDVFTVMFSERIPFPEASEPLLADIAARRHRLYEDFAAQSVICPLEKLAADVRSYL